MAMITWTRTCPPLFQWIKKSTSEAAYAQYVAIAKNDAEYIVEKTPAFLLSLVSLLSHFWAMAT